MEHDYDRRTYEAKPPNLLYSPLPYNQLLYFYEYRQMIDRAAVMLKYKSPAIEWINEVDPVNDDPRITSEDVNSERTVYLIRDEDGDDPSVLQEWIKLNYKILFENELEGWYVDENLWPKNRTLKLFHKWFGIECHTIIEDTVGAPINDDEI